MYAYASPTQMAAEPVGRSLDDSGDHGTVRRAAMLTTLAMEKRSRVQSK
jgi:hypothetical protein